MKKLKSKIKNIIEQETPSFDEWYQDNEQLVQEAVPTRRRQVHGVVKLRRITRWAVSCACVLLVLCISLPFVLKSPEEPPTYGSLDVGGVLIEDEKSYQYLRSMGLNFNLEYLNGSEMYTYETKELVMAIISGDYQIEDVDYYLLEFIYHLDDRYHFGDKSIYESLTDKVVVGDYTIYYGEGKPSELFVNYLLKIEYKGNVCYADVECFEHSFDDLVALLTGTLS
ncbi:MAG TPA: hypothetical protein IAD47_01695 [Candidatus Limihabitans stercoravium]|nr:hypothetical protein [Candidatus Limihabitans stercoravium]